MNEDDEIQNVVKVWKDAAGRELAIGDKVAYFGRQGNPHVGTLVRISAKGNPTILLAEPMKVRRIKRNYDGRLFNENNPACYAIVPGKTFVNINDPRIRLSEQEYRALPQRRQVWSWKESKYVTEVGQENVTNAMQDYRRDYDGVVAVGYTKVVVEVPYHITGQLGVGRLVKIEA